MDAVERIPSYESGKVGNMLACNQKSHVV